MEDANKFSEESFLDLNAEWKGPPHSGSIEIGDDDALLCPVCKNSYLHQGEVTAFHRREEDSGGIVAKVRHTSLWVQPASSEDLPGRRDTITIEFQCEDGCPTQVLTIQQHKGRTFVRWGNP